MIILTPWLLKALFSKCSPSTRRRNSAVSNSSGLKSVFLKLRFRDRLVDRLVGTAFSNFSGTVWTPLKQSTPAFDVVRPLRFQSQILEL